MNINLNQIKLKKLNHIKSKLLDLNLRLLTYINLKVINNSLMTGFVILK